MTHADPELSCMYPLRDWVTCVDACVWARLFRYSPKSTPSWLVMNMDFFPDLNRNNKNLTIQNISLFHYCLNTTIMVNQPFFVNPCTSWGVYTLMINFKLSNLTTKNRSFYV
jgi:hypothetical protein